MELLRWTRNLIGAFSARRDVVSMVRLQATNTTRQTLLASSLEVADTSATRRKGLLGRTGLGQGEGLWIRPCESVHTFFMKFPLDLVYLDRNLRVRKTRSNVGAWRISMCLFAHSVMELPVGAIRQSQTLKGDQLALTPVGNGQGVESF